MTQSKIKNPTIAGILKHKVDHTPRTTTIHNEPCKHCHTHWTFARPSQPAEEKKACETVAATRALETNGFERARGRIRKKNEHSSSGVR